MTIYEKKGDIVKKIILILLLAVFCSGLLIPTTMAKPDKIDGVNVPFGRIPQEIKDNRYPRTYFPGTEKLAKDEY